MPEASAIAFRAVLPTVLMTNTVDAVRIAAIRSHVRSLFRRDHHRFQFILDMRAAVGLPVCRRRASIDETRSVLICIHEYAGREDAQRKR